MRHRIKLLNGLTVVIVALMVGAAELLHEKEILFPEIAAIAIGALVAPRRAWQTSRLRILLLIALCAVSGVLIVRLVPLPRFAQMILAFALCQLLYLFSRTTFAPLISAMVLPVLLGTTSVVYPMAAICLTALILAVQGAVERLGLRSPEPYVPVALPRPPDFADAAIRVACMAVLTVPALLAGCPFVVAPPLLVAFTEFTRRDCPARRQPVKAVLLMALCGLLGALCRYTLTMCFSLPLTLAATVAAMLMLVLLHGFRLFLPPAGAITVLAMLLPDAAVLWYPLQILAGTAVLMALALLLFRPRRSATR